MALKATKLSVSQVELDLTDYGSGQTVKVKIDWTSDAEGSSSATYNFGQNYTFTGSSDTKTEDVRGGAKYTFTHSSSLNDPDQDIQINSSSGNSVSWGFEDGGGSGTTGVGGGNTDGDYNDGVITVTFISVTSDYIPDNSVCPTPQPWSNFGVITNCGSPPSLTTSANGINVTKSGNSVTINLSNYANKLTSINFSHSVTSSWNNSLGFNIAEASDIRVNGSDVGGNPYSKSSYSNNNMPSSSTIVLANLDGGNYNYTFTHSSTDGPVPKRDNWNRVCVDVTDPETQAIFEQCSCNKYEETYTGTWPPCPKGVWLVKSGGSTVEWVYSDGKDAGYESQRSTLTVSGTRPIVPATGPITMAIADQSLYIKGMSGGRFSVGSYRQYVNASLTNRLRFRDPVNRESKSELVTNTTDPSYDDDNYAAFSEFRLYAGAEPP